MSYASGVFSSEGSSPVLFVDRQSDVALALVFHAVENEFSSFRACLEYSKDNVCTWRKELSFIASESMVLKGLERGRYRLRCDRITEGATLDYEFEVKE